MTRSISPEVERANIRHLYSEIFWMSVAFAMEWYFMQVFAIRLGATPAHLGTLTSVRALLLAVGSGLASRWQARYNNPIAALSGPTLVYRLVLYVGIALSASMPAAQVDVLVGMVVLSALPTGIAQGCFLGMLPKAVTERQLASVVARRTVLMNVGVLIFVVGFLEGALPILLYHHERYDGAGYPFGLVGDKIPLDARIFSVVDSYDAMTSDRPYRKAMSHEEAMAEVRDNSGTQFDPLVVVAFEELMASKPHLQARAPHPISRDHVAHDAGFAPEDEAQPAA